jgi:hypothetical protein
MGAELTGTIGDGGVDESSESDEDDAVDGLAAGVG